MTLVLIAGLAVAVLILFLEAGGGLVGDSSMAPGCLTIMALVLVALFIAGLATGQIGIHFK